MIRNITQRFLLPAVLTLLTSQALAAAVELSGEVVLAEQQLDNKVVVGGAMVTVTDSRGVSVTTYTAENGLWELRQDALKPPLILRARAGAAYADTLLEIEPGARADISLALEALTDPKLISERLTASAHAASVNWQDADTKQEFISQCHFCHQIGNATTRVEKPKSSGCRQWSACKVMAR